MYLSIKFNKYFDYFIFSVIDMVYSEVDLFEGVGVGQGYSKYIAVFFFYKISIYAWQFYNICVFKK